MDEPKPQVTLAVVSATMSSPMFHAEAVERAMVPDIVPQLRELPELPDLWRISDPRRAKLELEIAIVVAVAVASSLIADGWVAVVVGSLGLLAVGFRRIDSCLPFSFGEGFVGYRADLGWPRGVQEDDDVRWNWTGPAPDARDTAA